eukprot:695765-Pleurochrysis_carterae.AAC.1
MQHAADARQPSVYEHLPQARRCTQLKVATMYACRRTVPVIPKSSAPTVHPQALLICDGLSKRIKSVDLSSQLTFRARRAPISAWTTGSMSSEKSRGTPQVIPTTARSIRSQRNWTE